MEEILHQLVDGKHPLINCLIASNNYGIFTSV
jgi:hypothetical protein